MNILYIGPYRQKDINGLTSVQILSYLIGSNKHNIKSAPIYSDASSFESDTTTDIRQSEQIVLSSYDHIIQHAPIDQLTKVNSIQKNTAIPIINAGHIKADLIDELSRFDSILVDTKLTYNRLSAYGSIRSKIHTFNYNISSLNYNIDRSVYDIGVLQQSTKLYFIGNYSNNITNIANLCKSFVANIQSNDYTLLLYLSSLDLSTKNNLEALIKQLYANNNFKHTINRILVMPIEINLTNIVRAHNTGDVFVDLQDDSSNSLNYKIAKYLNKTTIQYRAEDIVFSFDRNNKSSINGFEGISEYHINTSIKNIMSGSNTYADLPFKNKDLIQLI